MNKKYELTDIIMEHEGRTLYRIKALKDFNDVKAGDLGGWVESEFNLSHYDNCWIYDEGKVYDYGEVYENGSVYDNGKVYGSCEVYGYGLVFGNVEVSEGFIYTKISIPYKEIIQMQCKNRNINALLTENNEIVFNVGCQENITKEKFLDRIYNTNGGIEENPHRKEYIDAIDYMESYLKKYI